MAEGPIRAVVFDCDGVLVDTEAIWSVALRAVIATWAGADAAKRAPSMTGGSAPEAITALECVRGAPIDHDAFSRQLYGCVLRGIGRGVRAIPGAVELVRLLHGSRPLGVASNGSIRTVEASLAAAGFPPAFDAIVALEDSVRPKPAPDLYLRACARLRVDPGAAVALEDSARGARAASDAGMRVIGVGQVDVFGGLAELVVPDLADLHLLALLTS